MANTATQLGRKGGPSAAADPLVASWAEEAIKRATAIGEGKFARLSAWVSGAAAPAAIENRWDEAAAIVADDDEVTLNAGAILAAELRGRLASREAREKKTGDRSQNSGSHLLSSTFCLLSPVSYLLSPVSCAELFAKLPFREAIEALAKRLAITKEAFLALDAAARSRAFTMAHIADEELLANVHDELVECINDGETFADFKGRLAELRERSGWTGTSDWHYRLVYEQNLGMAYTGGRYQQGADDGLKVWRYLPSLSENPRPEHSQYVGGLYRSAPGHPMPPWDFNCNCGWEWVFPEELGGADPESFPEFDPPVPESGYQWSVGDYVGQAMSEAPPRHEDTKKNGGYELLACDVMLPVAAPDRMLILPWGPIHSKAGDFVVDEEAARSIIRAFAEQGVDLVIDYEHTTMGGEFASPDGSAPAMGWITGFDMLPGDGIYGQTRWTPQGQKWVSEHAYRYLSPTVLVRTSDRRAAALHSVSLTNKPAIAGMRPIVNSARDPAAHVEQEKHTQEKELKMKLKDEARQIAATGGLTDAQKLSKVLALVDTAPEPPADVFGPALVACAAELGEQGLALKEAAGKGDAPAAARELTLVINRLRKPLDMVPAKDVESLRTEVAALKQQLADGELETLIQANSEKLPPAERDGFKEFYRKDPVYAAKWLAAQPNKVNVSVPGGAVKPGENFQANKALQEEFGDEKAFAAFKRAEAAGLVTILTRQP